MVSCTVGIRFHGDALYTNIVISVALPRYTMVEFDLGNGKVVPPGYKIAIDIKAVHFNADIYPDPGRCDLFRFSNLRGTEEMGSKYGFATVDAHVSLDHLSEMGKGIEILSFQYLPFGAGKKLSILV